ncbi:MAG: 5'-nucleotidase C-terminal domain-containing protein, partial [Lachnospiraceae bacterium]|nr:5'-nucleotidase C-terminal domain-containing protein [Lachnospiraceae bacterium]
AQIFLDTEKNPMIEGLNMIGYDYWVAGNHDFNFGVPTLLRTADQFNGKFLCGNVSKDGETIGLTWDIKEVDGVKVAVIGMVTPHITRWDAANLEGYEVANPKDLIPDIVDSVKEQSDVIVFAYHADDEPEYGVEGSGAKDIAALCPDIDVILAAHGHHQVNETTENGVLLTENSDQGVSMSDIDITVEPDGAGGWQVKDKKAELIQLKDSEPDEAFVQAMADFDQFAREDAQIEIAELVGGDLVPETEIKGITQSQIQETSMMYLINTVQRHYAGAEVSAAAILKEDANIKEGKIRKCDIANIYKFDNTLYKLQMTGAQLKKYMEKTAEYYNTWEEGDLTISFNPDMRSYLYDTFLGVNYDINISKEPGSRIENLTKEDGTPIKDDDVITIAVNNYRANSQLLRPGAVYEEGDELPVLLEKDMEAGALIRDLIARWFTDDHYKGVVKPDQANNWKITGNNWDEAKHARAAELINAGLIKIPVSTDGRTPNVRSVTEEDIAPFEGIDLEDKEAELRFILFDGNGGNTDGGFLFFKDGQKQDISRIPTATRENYTFTGWFTEPEGGEEVSEADINRLIAPVESFTLYAQWKLARLDTPVFSATGAKKSINIAIEPVPNANKYIISYSLNKKMKKKVKKVESVETELTIEKLKSKKKYYVTVQAVFTQEGAEEVKSDVSKPVKVKVK